MSRHKGVNGHINESDAIAIFIVRSVKPRAARPAEIRPAVGKVMALARPTATLPS